MMKKSKTLTRLMLCLSTMIIFSISSNAFALNLFSFDTPTSSHQEQNKQPLAQQQLAQHQSTPKPVKEEHVASTEKVKTEADAVSDPKDQVEEERDLMEKALELLELADKAWKKGDIENTLNNLDKAYALVLDTNGDIEIARQKDDLRLLISRRILALYSSQQVKTNGKASEIPLLMNADVEKEIRSFQNVERDFFIASYQRSALHKDLIIKELKKAGVPEELFWLPLVESGFKVSALSTARALGLWQFIPSTGYKYGLTRDEWIDERMDIMKSTQAAIAYLKELHGMFGDWLTVLAAYNCGEGRVMRVISRQHINYFDRFWDLYNQLPNETARYVPRFLATLHIVRNPAKFGFDLNVLTDAGLDYETVKVNKMMKLSDIAEKIMVSEDVINILNAELRYKITPNREYELKIPKESLKTINMVYNEIPETEIPSFKVTRANCLKHRVRVGETVASIAKRYRVSTAAIYENNSRIKKNKNLAKGQIVLIPISRTEIAGKKIKTGSDKTTVAVKQKKIKSIQSYKVKKGDTLLSISRQFNVDVKKLKELNQLKTNNIQTGQNLKLPVREIGSDINEQEDNKKISKVDSVRSKKN